MNQIPHALLPGSTIDELDVAIQKLAFKYFPKLPKSQAMRSRLQNICAYMWRYYHDLKHLPDNRLTSLFTGWKSFVCFRRLQHTVKQAALQDKQTRLQRFLDETHDASIRSDARSWFRHIHTLCPKQPFQKIYFYDKKGQSLSPEEEFGLIKHYFEVFFRDEQFYSMLSEFVQMPIYEYELLQDFLTLLSTKAMVPLAPPLCFGGCVPNTLQLLPLKAVRLIRPKSSP